MRLIYLGQSFEYSTRTLPLYRSPSAVNWRYQLPGELYGEETPSGLPGSTPKVVSWRWQVPDL